MPRLYLSPPDVGPADERAISEAFASGWIAPLGPHVDAFQTEFAEAVGARHAVALSSGTAALHLALIAAGVGAGDEVICSSLTFAASANAIAYVGAAPVFIDSERESWNLDPALLEQEFEDRAKQGRLPKAVMLVHLYGQSADTDAIKAACDRYGVILIEDAAEALGATYKGRVPGSDGIAGGFSFNGNKIITTSGGGMLVTPDQRFAALVQKLATQAREPAPHYEHALIGYNYRLSNLLAALGRSQLRTLPQRVAARRAHTERYRAAFASIDGIAIQPEASWGTHSRWLTVIEVDPVRTGTTREAIRLALEAQDIEARPVWKPMHMQPVFRDARMIGGAVAESVFAHGLCLPSGSNMSVADHARVCDVVHEHLMAPRTSGSAA